MRDFSGIIVPDGHIINKKTMKQVSVSQIEQFQRCSLSWLLQRKLKLPQVFSQKLAFGNSYHHFSEVLNTMVAEDESIFKKTPAELKELIDIDFVFAEFYDGHDLDDIAVTNEKTLITNARNIYIEAFLEEKFRPLMMEINGVKKPCVEIGMEVQIPDPFTGEFHKDHYIQLWADLIGYGKDGELVIRDNKTAGATYSEMKISTALQLPLYAYAFGELFKQKGIAYNNRVEYACFMKVKKPYIKNMGTGEKDNDRPKYVKPEDIDNAFRTISLTLDSMRKKAYFPQMASDLSHLFCSYSEVCLKNRCLDWPTIMSYVNGEREEPMKPEIAMIEVEDLDY